MRTAPPLQLRVNRFGVWRAGSLLLAACVCAAMLSWWYAQPTPTPLWASAVTGCAVLGSLACVATLWRTAPLTLRWDGQRWWLARDEAAEQAGELALAIDLGSWLLLRFVPASEAANSAWRRHPVWIALQRRGLEAQWHSLRCALYGARPAAVPEIDRA